MSRIEFEVTEHRYRVDGQEKLSVTQVLARAGRVDLSRIPLDILDRAAERGTKFHRAAALLMTDRLDWSSLDPAIAGYVLALDAWIRHSRFQPDPHSVERPLYCATWDYCGTPDVCGHYPRARRERRGVNLVVDFKTGMMPGVRYQLAAYAVALGFKHRAAVKLNSNGTYFMSWFDPGTLAQDFAVFCGDLGKVRAAATQETSAQTETPEAPINAIDLMILSRRGKQATAQW